MRLFPLFVLILVTAVEAQDTVVCKNGLTELQFSGKIVDWNLNGIELTLPSGQTKVLPENSIVRVHASRTSEMAQAQLRFEKGEYAQAAALLKQIVKQKSEEGTHDWTVAETLGLQVRCYENLDQLDAAAARFALLASFDPDSSFLRCCPLVWSAATPTSSLTQAASGWLGLNKSDYLTLLGGSILLTTSDKGKAQAALQKLERSDDPTIVALASFQLLRLKMSALTNQEKTELEARFRSLPTCWQSGPSFQLGRLYSLSQEKTEVDTAILYYLRTASNSNCSERLSIRALQSAAALSEANGRPAEAEAIQNQLKIKTQNSNSGEPVFRSLQEEK